MEGVFPNLIVAGFEKCGTSSLWYWLADHPEVCGSSIKETCFFHDKAHDSNKNANYHSHGLGKYPDLFKGCENHKIVFEATPSYANKNTALDLIPQIKPSPKLLFLLREPSERVFSFFRFHKYRLKDIPADVSFADFIQNKNAWNRSKIQIDLSCYIEYLQKWVENVGKENVGVFVMEEMFQRPQAFMEKICKFLDIDSDFYRDYYFPKGNQTVKIKSSWLHKLGGKIQPLIPHWFQNRFLIPMYLKFNAEKIPSPTGEDLEVKNWLKSEFRNCNDRLADEFDLDLSFWN